MALIYSLLALFMLCLSTRLVLVVSRPVKNLLDLQVTVLCDVCNNKDLVPVSGARMSLECKKQIGNYQTSGWSMSTLRVEQQTDSSGLFRVSVPKHGFFKDDCSLVMVSPPLEEAGPLSTCTNFLAASSSSSSSTTSLVYQGSADEQECSAKSRILVSTQSLSLGPPDPQKP